MPLCFYLAGFGAGTPQQEAVLKGTGNFQELKICGHGTVLALYRCAQNRFWVIVSELLRRKKQVEVVLLM